MAILAIRKSFGSYLRTLRERRQLGLREVSRRISQQPGARGLSPAYLSLMERGYVEIPQPHILRHLSMALDVDEDQFASIAKGQRLVMISELFQGSPHHQSLLASLQTGTARYPDVLSAIVTLMRTSPKDFQGLRTIGFHEGASDGFLSFDRRTKR